MANIALDEANALQKRIDALVKKRDSIKVPQSKLWKEYEEISDKLTDLSMQLQDLHRKADAEQTEYERQADTERARLNSELSVLTVARDALLTKAQG